MKKIQKAFTIVELVVIITILSILSTIYFIAIPQYPTQEEIEAKQKICDINWETLFISDGNHIYCNPK